MAKARREGEAVVRIQWHNGHDGLAALRSAEALAAQIAWHPGGAGHDEVRNVAFGCLTTGCAAPDPIQTLSGKPDVTVTASMKCLRAGLLAEMVDQGWSIVTTSDVQIVAQKPFDSGTAKMLLTNGLGVPPMRRMTLMFIEVGSTNIRVVRDTGALINDIAIERGRVWSC